MTALVWVFALLVVGLAVMVLEVFVPSGGVLGFLSVVAIAAAVVMAFAEGGAAVGLAVLAVVVAAVPVVLAVAFRIFPETPLGRRVLPPPPTPDDVLPEADHRRRLRALVGRRGRAASELVPWGTVEIDGGTHEARADRTVRRRGGGRRRWRGARRAGDRGGPGPSGGISGTTGGRPPAAPVHDARGIRFRPARPPRGLTGGSRRTTVEEVRPSGRASPAFRSPPRCPRSSSSAWRSSPASWCS
jgi:hypothetical protein